MVKYLPPYVRWTDRQVCLQTDFRSGCISDQRLRRRKIGVRIDVKDRRRWSEIAKTKMNNIINTGEYFDLMFVNNTNYTKFVKSGYTGEHHRPCSDRNPRSVQLHSYRPTVGRCRIPVMYIPSTETCKKFFPDPVLDAG